MPVDAHPAPAAGPSAAPKPASRAGSSFALKPLLVSVHRWVGLILAPLFLVIILTGGVLALRPIVDDFTARANAGARVDAAAVSALVGRLEAQGALNGFTVGERGSVLDVSSNASELSGRWDIASGTRLGPAPLLPQVFAVAQSLHTRLMLGLQWVVEIATYAMAAIMLMAPFLAWLKFRNTLMGWHLAIGWLLLPLTLASPITGILMTLGVGQPPRPPQPQSLQPQSLQTQASQPQALQSQAPARPSGAAEGAAPQAASGERPGAAPGGAQMPLGAALGMAGRELDLATLTSGRRFRGGSVMLRLDGPPAMAYTVSPKGVTPLTGGPGLPKQIHEGTWGGAWSGALNLLIAFALLGLTGTGFLSWFRRWRRDRVAALDAGADILVAHASQTGTAAHLAEATAAALVAGGQKATVAPLGAVSPAQLKRFRLILLIAATTGEGEVPDGARHVPKTLPPGALEGVRFAVLGLGDRSYAQFCGGAHTLRTALLAAGGVEALPLATADGDPAAAWGAWIGALETQLGLTCVAPQGFVAAPPVPLTLAARERLDDPSGGDTQETWRIVLASDQDLVFRPGDLLRLRPAQGGRERSYSIGSSSRVDPRRIELTVRLHRFQDDAGREVLGAVSGRLVRTEPVGARLEAQLQAHPGFNPPADPQWPILMIGAGSGIAPFPGFIAERRASGRAGPAWLVFGNRHKAGDFLWRREFEAALADGSLARLDTAFSRDAGDGARVQDRLRAVSDELLRWLLDRKAVIYVCGRRDMARGVEEALADMLVAGAGYAAEAARAEIARWLAEGRMRIDAFD